MSSHEDVYKVKDLYEAAYLYSAGRSLVGLEKVSSYYLFVFSDSVSCIQGKSAYWSNSATVNPKLYADSLKSLKELIFLEAK